MCVGDRHLENVLVSARGEACGADCGALRRGGELPPARLTRALLALAPDPESRLQNTIQLLRESKLVLPSISVAFKWMGGMYMDELRYVTGLIKGTSISHAVTIEVISKSTQPYREKYVQLLEDVFRDFDAKELYSVEEQVSSLLLQCTDPRILSVTRASWEPWI
ncbi:uncharacterized protein LOC124541515 [Vanessa cardui]|uniref:uncharacterized protein LOC124541515 n=1 Tax=Vanessa cardui TaxID=171605 RepID=UPI001F144552|nr:uncharacterized protein LOC124541515 [Vanessa cardui]